MSEGPNQRGEFREDEQSDLFSLKSYQSTNSIPVIERVPLTKEELRRRTILRVVYGVAAAATVAFAVWLFLHLSHLSDVEEAMHAASDDGRVASIRSALDLLDDDDDDGSEAMKLRLRAMLVLAGEAESTAPIAAGLAALPEGDPDVTREREVAEIYLALAEGNLEAAMQHASQVVASGDYSAEAARARAMAARAVGNVDTAFDAASLAVNERPDAPRHVALHAELLARRGDTEGALQSLDALGTGTPGTRIARARIMDRAGAAIDAVAEHAQAVLDAPDATMHEKAWARLLLAAAAAAAGDRVTAREHLDQAQEVAPPGDELFTLGLAEAALRIQANHLAAEVAENLPSPLSVDAGRRAQLNAELALSRRDLRAAEAALQHAPADAARTRLARARLLQARGRVDEARALYRQAADEPGYRVPATVHQAAMELEQGEAARAVELAAPLLTEHPNHPDVVPVAVEAQLGEGHAEQAMALVTPALERHPRDVRLLAAKAHVQMALEQWEAALGTLDTALRIEDDDADLHADRGRAARRLDRLEVAREAFDRALALNESHPIALVGRLELDVLDYRPAEGRQILDRIDEAEVDSLEVERLRGRLLMMEIAGQSGVREMRTALDDHSRDPELTMALGWLYMQAEQYSQAVRTFQRLVGTEEGGVEATLARALAQIRMRASNPAQATLENLTEGLDESTLPPATRAQLHAVLARLALANDSRPQAERELAQALELDRRNSEAHLVRAEILSDRDEDATESLQAALTGRHPSSKPLALLSIREEQVTRAICDYADRYRRAAPNGQFARGVWRVQRDCRQLD